MVNRIPPDKPSPQDKPSKEPPEIETLRSAAAHYLLQGAQQEAAALLLSLNIEIDSVFRTGSPRLFLNAVGAREIYDRFVGGYAASDPLAWQVIHALDIVGKSFGWNVSLGARFEIPQLTSDDQRALVDLALGRHVHNQAPGVPLEKVVLWENLRFRSQTEAKIAQALERTGAAFWPNCRARVGEGRHRRNLEADFVVLWKGVFGILEIDGEPWHPPERRAEEQVRDRIWHRHGLAQVQHYDAARAYNQPDGVVRDFLRILEGPQAAP